MTDSAHPTSHCRLCRQLLQRLGHAAAAIRTAAGDGTAPTSAWSAAASPAARQRWRWPSAAIGVVLLEAQRVGWGASGRSGGQVTHRDRCRAGRSGAAGRDRAMRAGSGTSRSRAWRCSSSASRVITSTATGWTARCTPRSSRASGGSLQSWQDELAGRYGYPQHAPARARGAARAARHASATSARSTTATAGICTRCATRSGSRARPRAGRRSSSTRRSARHQADRSTRGPAAGAHRHGSGRLRAAAAGRQRLARRARCRRSQRKLMSIASYVDRHRTARRAARARR